MDNIWWTSGVKTGPITMFVAKARTGKSKLMLNSKYGWTGSSVIELKPHFRIEPEPFHGEWEIIVVSGYEMLRDWCQETMGVSGNNRKYRWRETYSLGFWRTKNRSTRSIYLRNEQDVLMFRMRWS